MVKNLLKGITISAFIFLIFAKVTDSKIPVESEKPKPKETSIEYKDTITKYSEENEIDPFLILAIISVESKFDSIAVSKSGAIGLMQIMPQTGEWISEQIGQENFNEDDLYNSEINIKMGTWYVKYLIGEYGGNIENVLAAYNGGPGNVNEWLKDKSISHDGYTLHNIPYEETSEYIGKVKGQIEVFRNYYKGIF